MDQKPVNNLQGIGISDWPKALLIGGQLGKYRALRTANGLPREDSEEPNQQQAEYRAQRN